MYVFVLAIDAITRGTTRHTNQKSKNKNKKTKIKNLFHIVPSLVAGHVPGGDFCLVSGGAKAMDVNARHCTRDIDRRMASVIGRLFIVCGSFRGGLWKESHD